MRVRWTVLFAVLLVCASGSVPLGAAPGAPTNLVASVTGASVTLIWNAPAGSVTGYRLEAGMAPGQNNAANVVVGPTPSFSTNGVPAGTYYVRIRAIASDGESAPSNEAVVVVGGTASCAGVPTAPALNASVNGSRVELSWTVSGACAANSYTVYAGSVPGAGDLAALDVGASTSLVATAPNGTYYVYVAGRNAYGISPSNVVTVVVGGQSTTTALSVNTANASIGMNGSGHTVLMGEVTNTTSHMVIFTKVKTTLQNTGGTVLGSATTYLQGVSRDVGVSAPAITDTTLAPGESGCFYLVLPVPRQAVGRVNFEVEAERAGARTLAGRPVLTGNLSASSSGSLRLEGSMRNDGSVLTYFNRAMFFITRADGLAVGCDFAYASGTRVTVDGLSTDTGLLPGQTASFAQTTHAPAPAATIRAWTQWAEGNASVADADLRAGIEMLLSGSDADPDRARALWQSLEAARERAYRLQPK